MATINLNDYVWVELTPYGWQSLTSYYEKLFSGMYAFSKGKFSTSNYVDALKKTTEQHTIDGVERTLTRFQLHEFMLLLGSQMYVGNNNVIVDNNLFFDLDK